MKKNRDALKKAKSILKRIIEGDYEKRVYEDYNRVIYGTELGNLILISSEDYYRVDNEFFVEFTENNDMQDTIYEFTTRPSKTALRKAGFNKEEQRIFLMLMLSILQHKKLLFERRVEQMIADYDFYISKIKTKLEKQW